MNDEARMTNVEGMPKHKIRSSSGPKSDHPIFGIPLSFVIDHSSFRIGL